MKRLIFLITTLTATLLCHGQNVNISGVINQYTIVNTIAGNNITVSSSSGFSIGDKVLIIQMQGADINETNSSAFGDVNAFGDAGNYEFATVCSISSSTEIILNDIQRTYTPSENVQLVYVPVYNDATITGTLTAPAWDGTTGGVLAFECTGTITMNYGVDLQGFGFRGGEVTTSAHSCSWISPVTDYFYDILTGEGAKKGEGVGLYITGKTGGRGAQTNGGGGGNDHNSGGGGGGNIGAGGQGGERIKVGTFYCGGQSPGVGGKSNPYTNAANKLFMGGGGGAGHENNANTATPGCNGGGIVIIKAVSLNGGGQTINVEGGATPANSVDGGGGGGAGGSVLLSVTTYSGTLNINASGSSGGSVSNVGTSNCNGPGGGGGGGILWVNQGSIPGSISLNNDGAPSGTTVATSQSNCTVGSTNNALPGNNGITLTGLSLFESNCNTAPITESTSICEQDSIFLGGAWQHASGTYYDTVTSGCCDTVFITTLSIIDTSLHSNAIQICSGDSLFLEGGWQTSSGTYVDSFQTTTGCDSILETTLTINAPLTNVLSQTICNGDSIVVNGTTYNSTTVVTETFNNIGPYNCDSIVTIDLTVLPALTSTINNTICADDSIMVNGNTYNATNPTGTEVYANIGPSNCDSVVTIDLTVLLELTGSVTSAICLGDSVMVNGNTYNANNSTGTELFTNTGPYNCDSIVIIDLAIISIDTSVTINTSTLTSNMLGGNYQWLDCNNNYGAIGGETNQSFTAFSSGAYAVELIKNGCLDTSSCFTITISTSIDYNFREIMRVSPCPTNGMTAIDLGAKYKNVSISLLDISGKLIHKEVFEQKQHLAFTIPDPAGLYLLHIEAEGNQATLRVIKK